jgi:choline-glycine betaine transporter
MNDDQRANMAMFVTFLHWGLHGWATYILVALTLGVVHYRLGRPLTLRSAFYPIVGDYVNGLFGDLIDSMSIACTTFGLCTSLGLGASSINTILHRMSASIPDDDDNTKSAIIWGITALTTGALVSGLHRGVITFAIVAFSILLALIMILFMLDNTWYLANSFTQQIGTYLQYVILGGFDNDAMAQLNIEFTQKDTHLWGAQGIKQLVETALNKTLADPTTYYSSSPTSFMDTWTVFYWAWWITWAPFVGMFYAKISRGRTIRSLILVGMFAPMFLGFFAISVLGSLGIRMQRIAELALGAAPDWQKGVVNCGALGYLENTPVSADAKKLASELGVYALACRKSTDRILDILEPYKNLTTLLQTLVLLGVILFFVTSAEAGAFVDDMIAANGMENPPVLQKVWWSITQGATAQALLSSTKNGLSTLQSVSICAALPYTFALNYMCVALFRAMDETNEDPTYMKMRKGFSTSIVDVFENFHKADGTMATKQASTKDRLLLLLRTILNPRRSLTTAGLELFKPLRLSVLSFGYGLVYLLWILLLALSPLDKGTHTLAWLMYLIFTSITAAVRYNLRKKWYIIGNLMDDFFVCFFFYPFALAQMQLEVESHTGRAVEHGRANFVPANTMKAADD